MSDDVEYAAIYIPYYVHDKKGYITPVTEEEGHWVVVRRWQDEQGRRCTRYICEAFSQPDQSGEQTATMIADLLNKQDG